MRNMKTIFTKLACFLLALFMSGTAIAESITSPDGQLRLNFSVNLFTNFPTKGKRLLSLRNSVWN